ERRQGVRLLQERLNRTALTRKGRSVWSQSVIHRMLRNPIYKGRHASGIKAPPIISEELFDRAIARLVRNKRLHRHIEKITPLQGLVDCHCGATWRIERAKPARKSPAYMYCFHRRRQSNWVTGGNPRCTVPPIRLDRFEQLVHAAFKDAFSDPVRFKLVVENTIRDLKRELIEKQADIQPLRDELTKVSDRIRRITREYLEGEIDEEELDLMRERARHRRTVLEDQLAKYSPTRIDELEDLERLIRGAEDHIRLAETRERLGMPMGEFSWNPELAISEAAQEYTDSGVWPRKRDVNHREIAEDLERWLSYLDARIVVEEGTARVSGTIPQDILLDNDTLHASRKARGLGCG
ncbi:MAG: recombinase family protein, partial [Chloroflexi bacterium]|nr:recombinase family protein [Chloroflexota bacterium]